MRFAATLVLLGACGPSSAADGGTEDGGTGRDAGTANDAGPGLDAAGNTDPFDWSMVSCDSAPDGPDPTVDPSDMGEAGWPPGASRGADGVVTMDHGTLHPILEQELDGLGSDPAGVPSYGADFGELCVRLTNSFRATEGLEPYVRMVQDEVCASNEAKEALEMGAGHVLTCPGRSQNSCGGTALGTLMGTNFCFRLHWTEAQTQGGHYGGQMRAEPRYMACAHWRRQTADTDDEPERYEVRTFQDFYNHTTPGRLEGAEDSFFSDATPPPAGSLTASAVAPGGNHTCALLTDGSVRCWGDSFWGQAGTGMRFHGSRVPGAAIALSSSAVQVVSGYRHSCALLDDGTVQCWGADEYSQLGISEWRGHFRQILEHYETVPTDTINLPAGDPVVHLAAAHHATCATLQSGAVHCWGQAFGGALGRPTVVGDGGAGWSAFGAYIGDESPNLRGLTDAHMGSAHGCGLIDGGAWCWGRDFRGQVGDGQRETLYFAQNPSQNDNVLTADDPTVLHQVIGLQAGVTRVVTGAEHSCAILQNGQVRCWGANRMGQLGFDGEYPAEIAGEGVDSVTSFEADPVDVCLERPTVDLALGGAHTCALLDTGRVWCWGSANHGKLGTGHYHLDSPVPAQVPGLEDVVEIESRHMHTCAVTATGQVYCWGLNYYGQIGDGTAQDQAQPTLVTGF